MSELIDNFLKKISEILPQKNPPKTIAVGVSGGIDSLALTLLLNDFCREKKIKLLAVTIDHKIRKSSSDEALRLQKFLKSKKISHQILEVDHKQIPQNNIEAKLRQARYELLHDFCTENKIQFLFLGHQLSDVAENFLIRLFRGSGLDGLSTIAELSEFKNIKLARPLLNIEKDQLEKFLKQKKVKWFEDETNQDEKFLRNKIRRFFAEFPEQNLIQKRIKNASDEIAKMRDFFDAVLLQEARKIVTWKELGYFTINIKKLQKLEERIALKILALALMEISQKDYKPRLVKLRNFYDWAVKNEGEKAKPGSKKNQQKFYGCIAIKRSDLLELHNENGDKKISLRTILSQIV